MKFSIQAHLRVHFPAHYWVHLRGHLQAYLQAYLQAHNVTMKTNFFDISVKVDLVAKKEEGGRVNGELRKFHNP